MYTNIYTYRHVDVKKMLNTLRGYELLLIKRVFLVFEKSS